MREDVQPLSPLPPGTVRGRCWCDWWIVVPEQLGLCCPACEVPIMKATQRDLDAVGQWVDYSHDDFATRRGRGRKSKEELIEDEIAARRRIQRESEEREKARTEKRMF